MLPEPVEQPAQALLKFVRLSWIALVRDNGDVHAAHHQRNHLADDLRVVSDVVAIRMKCAVCIKRHKPQAWRACAHLRNVDNVPHFGKVGGDVLAVGNVEDRVVLSQRASKVERREEVANMRQQPSQARVAWVGAVLCDPEVHLRHDLFDRVRRVHRADEVDECILFLQMALAAQQACVGQRARTPSHTSLLFYVLKQLPVAHGRRGGSGGGLLLLSSCLLQ
mmetsp:Transcript_24296/g.72123  ORF Transcript_24296/g.72123 Transcript_24296/m.72123 type:complete len:222 (-) Transcript_24296:1033-1698(-)